MLETPSVLLADDDADIRTLYSLYLGHCGLEVLTAADGAGALREARSKHPDVLLMDLRLPDMDGFEAIRQLRRDPATAEIPVIAFSARGRAADRAEAGRLGCEAFLAKPCLPEDVLSEITSVLGRSWLRQIELRAKVTHSLQAYNELVCQANALSRELHANRESLRQNWRTTRNLLYDLKDLLGQSKG